MKFVCETCNVWVSTGPQWVGHLVSEPHQTKTLGLQENTISVKDSEQRSLQFVSLMPKVMKWTENDKKRSILVTGFAQKMVSFGMLGAHFSRFGFITEFVGDATKGYAVIQFDLEESVTQVLQFPGNCVVLGKSCKIKALESIKELEWLLLLELDAVCSQVELPNLLQHTLMMTSVREYGLCEQFVIWLYRTSVIGQGIVIRNGVIKDLSSILRLQFPSLYVFNITILLPGYVDFDQTMDIYVDPFSHCSASYTTPIQPDYVCFKYQQAIQHILHTIKNQTIGSVKHLYHEISTFSNPNVPGVVAGINFSQNGIPCRIRFDGAMEATVTSLVSFYISLDPRVLPFLRFIHYWARLLGLTKKYPEIRDVLTMLGLIYFQIKRDLPSVSVLQQLAYTTGCGASITGHCWIEGCNVAFSKDVTAINAYLKTKGKNMEFSNNCGGAEDIPQIVNQKVITSVLECLVDFFDVFGTNDLRTYVGSPFIGNLVYRSVIEEKTPTPDNHAAKRIKELCGGLDLSQPIIIQHPFNMKKNLAENIDTQFWLYTQGLFRDISSRIKRGLYESNRNLLNIFPDILPHLHRTQSSRYRDRDSGCSSLVGGATKSESLADLSSLQQALNSVKNKTPTRPSTSYSHVAQKPPTSPVPATSKPSSTSVLSPHDKRKKKKRK